MVFGLLVDDVDPVVARLQNFCSEDLGGFYLDILKDRLYTTGVDSFARRSAQTALWHIAHALLRIMAPILSFMAEEAWAVFAGEDAYKDSDETIFTQTLRTFPAILAAAALLDEQEELVAQGDILAQGLQDGRQPALEVFAFRSGDRLGLGHGRKLGARW